MAQISLPRSPSSLIELGFISHSNYRNFDAFSFTGVYTFNSHSLKPSPHLRLHDEVLLKPFRTPISLPLSSQNSFLSTFSRKIRLHPLTVVLSYVPLQSHFTTSYRDCLGYKWKFLRWENAGDSCGQREGPGSHSS